MCIANGKLHLRLDIQDLGHVEHDGVIFAPNYLDSE
jgi:hypothetical protein